MPLPGFRTALRVAGLLLAIAVPAAAASAQESPAPERPRVGLVLSGGGARGLAHMGVLEVLDQLRVPVDLIAGTSMGAIVGGLYASGLPPDSMHAVVAGLDWERILADAPPRTSLPYQRRAEGRRYPVELEIGITRGGLTLPSGLISGQDLGLLLRRQTLPMAAVEDFSQLPIPFGAVATDIETGERVVLDRGDLVEAMRASMAIPVVFSPVERDRRILVDGGLVDNIPVELARAMGADVVIVVDATPPLLDRDELRSVLGISQQVVNLLARQNLERELASADLALDLELDGVGIFDFRDADTIIARGAAVARDSAGSLSRWALSVEEYAAHRSARGRRRPALPPRPGGLSIEAPAWLDERLVLARVDAAILDTLDPDLAERAALDVYALGEFERVGYDLTAAGTATDLVLYARAKPRGPRLLRMGIDLATDSADEAPALLTFGGRLAYVRTRIGARSAEWRTDLLVGTTTGIETAFRQPLDFGGRWFVEPSVQATEVQRPVFRAEAAVSEYETRRLRAAIEIGRSLGLSSELRAGLAWGRATSQLDPPAEELSDRFPAESEDQAELRIAFVLDRLDSINLPRRGMFASAEARFSREELGAERSWRRLSLEARGYGSRGSHTVFASLLAGGASPAAALPVREEFRVGGFGSLGGYGEGELRGEAFVVGRAGWLRRIAEIPPALRGIVAGGWIEAGDAWHPSEDAELDLRPSATVAAGAETAIGPVFLAWSRAEAGRRRVTLSVGRWP